MRDWQSHNTSQGASNILSRWLSTILKTKEVRDLHAQIVTTLSFKPSTDYVAQSMESEKIQKYVRKRHFRASLYMVTAVKIVRKLRISALKHILIGLTIGVDSAVLAEAPSDSSAKHASIIEIPEVVFAYSVRRIIFDREHTRYLDRTGMGLFITYNLCELEERGEGNTVKDDDEDLEMLERIDVIGLERKDVGADDLGVFSNALIDESTGKEVEGIIISELSDTDSSV